MLFDSTLPIRELCSKLESIFLNLINDLSTSLCNTLISAIVSTMFIAFSPEVNSSQKTTFFAHLLKPYHKTTVTSSGCTFNSSYLAISMTSAVITITEVLNPFESSMTVKSDFFHTPVNVDILTSSYESKMYFQGIYNSESFQEGFILLCPNPSEK